jgi:hypothetical protein
MEISALAFDLTARIGDTATGIFKFGRLLIERNFLSKLI